MFDEEWSGMPKIVDGTFASIVFNPRVGSMGEEEGEGPLCFEAAEHGTVQGCVAVEVLDVDVHGCLCLCPSFCSFSFSVAFLIAP